MLILEPLLYYKFNTRDLNNVNFEYIDCKFEKVVMTCDKPYDSFINGYGNIVKVKNEARMYYRSGTFDGCKKMTDQQLIKLLGSFLKDYECLCLAFSSDGLNFQKLDMKMCRYEGTPKGRNNVIRRDHFCHNFYVNYDHNLNKYIGIAGLKSHNDGIFLFESKNGIKWEQKHKILDDKNLLGGWRHPNHFDTLSVLVYNPEFRKYYLYTRHNSGTHPSRRVQVAESSDLVRFSKCREVRMSELGDSREIYIPGVMIYPGTSYFMAHTCSLSLVCRDKINMLMTSRDGINFDLVKEGVVSNRRGSILPVSGMIEMNDKFYIYVIENEGKNDNAFLCFSYTKNRIGCLSAWEIGSFLTNNIVLSDKYLIINYETMEDGYVELEVYSVNGELLYRLGDIRGNDIERRIDIHNVHGNQEIYLKFIMRKAKIYSYSYNK